METIGSYIKKLLAGTSGILYLMADEENSCIEPVLHWGELVLEQKEFAVSGCYALQRYQLYEVPDTSHHLLCKHVEDSKIIPHNYVCFPLFVQRETLGLIYIELNRNTVSSISQKLIDLGQMVSEKIALNLYNIKLKNSLRIQSMQDSLTGLHNRRFFEEFIQKEISKAKRYPITFALLLLDIDHFKAINDTHGHLVGDKVLCQITNLLRKELRENDLIARWGGEEFILLLREISLDKTRAKAEKLRRSIENLIMTVNGEKLTVTVSIGIGIFDGEVDKDVLIKKADDALYQAKNSGRNKVILNIYDQFN